MDVAEDASQYGTVGRRRVGGGVNIQYVTPKGGGGDNIAVSNFSGKEFWSIHVITSYWLEITTVKSVQWYRPEKHGIAEYLL